MYVLYANIGCIDQNNFVGNEHRRYFTNSRAYVRKASLSILRDNFSSRTV